MDFALLATLSVGALFFIFFVGMTLLIFEVVMFIDALINKQISSQVKLLWLIGMLLIHPFVAIAYYFTDRKKSL